MQSGVDEGNPPVGYVGLEELDLAGVTFQDEIIGPRLVVVQEEILDRGGPVTETQNEIGMSEMRIIAHYVPEHRALPDHRHRLGTARSLVAHPHAQATAEENDLHQIHLI